MARQQNSRLLLPLLVAAALILAVVPVRKAFVGPAPSTLRGSALTQSSRSVDVARAATGYPLDDSDLVQPDQEPERITYLIGFVRFAENLNGRVRAALFPGPMQSIPTLQALTLKSFAADFGIMTGRSQACYKTFAQFVP